MKIDREYLSRNEVKELYTIVYEYRNVSGYPDDIKSEIIRKLIEFKLVPENFGLL